MASKYDRIYNKIVKDVEKLTGNKETYGSDLERHGRTLLGRKLRGVFPSDKIPELNDLVPYAILNLDSSKQPGSHWIAVAKKQNKNELLMYDSFGRGYKKIIPQLGRNMRVYNTEDDQEQNIREQNCGARSLGFLLMFDLYGWDVSKTI